MEDNISDNDNDNEKEKINANNNLKNKIKSNILDSSYIDYILDLGDDIYLHEQSEYEEI